MRNIIFCILFEMLIATGMSQQLIFKFGTPFQRTDLDVRWNVHSSNLPSNVWVYRLLPHPFSANLISNLVTLGGFDAKNVVVSNANTITFQKPDFSCLGIVSDLGAIEFRPKHRHFDATHLAQKVPSLVELPALTTNFLPQLGISVADIEKSTDGSPNFHFAQPFTVFVLNHKFVTNITFRSVGFRREVDGAPFVGNGAGGDCHIEFGEYGKPSNIMMSWRNLERYKAYPTASPETLIRWIRDGKAVQGMIRMDAEPIDWKTVKSISISATKLCYYGGDQFKPSGWLMPFVALWTTVDRGHGTIDVEIDCPIIDPQSTK